MADIADVEQALVASITASLYPSGPEASSIIGTLCRIYRGWPNAATLNADLNAGSVNVTVVTDNDAGKTTTRYLPRWYTTPSQPGTTLTATAETMTIAGVPTVGDVVGALIDGAAYAYRIEAGDSATLVASNLCQLIQANRPAIAQGSSVEVPGAGSITTRVVSDCAATFESRRQEKDVRIICWSPTPSIRDAVASAIDSAINPMSFITLPDGCSARITYRNTASHDQSQNALLYRRDLVYTIEYPTITLVKQASMLFGASDINGNIIYG